MLLNRQLLESHVVLEHLAEVNGHRLADCFVYWIVDIKFFECVIARIEDTENTNDTVMIYLIVSQVEGQEFVMGEEKLSNHHSTICLDFIASQIQVLKACALSKGFGQILSTLALYLVALNVKTKETVSSAQQITK